MEKERSRSNTNYGKLHDERYALEAVLEASKDYVGKDKKIYCNMLIQELKESLAKREEIE